MPGEILLHYASWWLVILYLPWQKGDTLKKENSVKCLQPTIHPSNHPQCCIILLKLQSYQRIFDQMLKLPTDVLTQFFHGMEGRPKEQKCCTIYLCICVCSMFTVQSIQTDCTDERTIEQKKRNVVRKWSRNWMKVAWKAVLQL